ncbi:MAG: GIY-YIG nuclease family protein [Candidatus Roizmanbacteria bacterium]
MVGYVYILRSKKDEHRYIGSTDDLVRRLRQHSQGFVSSTKNRRPLILEGVLEFKTLVEARIRERQFKKSRGALERAIQNNIRDIV